MTLKSKENNRYKWADFREISNVSALIGYFHDYHAHQEYCHYASLGKIDNILSRNQFWLSDSSELNDINDKKQFASARKKHYMLCFSTGKNENLPMWYLYSGVDGKGGRVRFGETFFRRAIEHGSFALQECQNENRVTKLVGEAIPLTPGGDIDIRVEDVLYVQEKDTESTLALKYNTMTNYQVPRDALKEYKKEHFGFIKDLIWFYEKETRIIVSLSDAIYAKIENDGKKYKVLWSFLSEQDKGSKKKSYYIDLAPQIKKTELTSALEGHDHIKRFLQETSNVQFSQYSGGVDFSICRNCEKNKYT